MCRYCGKVFIDERTLRAHEQLNHKQEDDNQDAVDFNINGSHDKFDMEDQSDLVQGVNDSVIEHGNCVTLKSEEVSLETHSKSEKDISNRIDTISKANKSTNSIGDDFKKGSRVKNVNSSVEPLDECSISEACSDGISNCSSSGKRKLCIRNNADSIGSDASDNVCCCSTSKKKITLSEKNIWEAEKNFVSCYSSKPTQLLSKKKRKIKDLNHEATFSTFNDKTGK